MTRGSDRDRTRLWRDRRFATYWVGDAVSTFGDRISELALPLIALTMLGASPAQVGLLLAAVWTPNLLSVVVGAWVERQARKKRLMIMANLIQAGAIVSVPIAHLVAEISFAQLVAVALLQGLGGVLFATSSQPFFVAVVRQESYVEANSLLSGTRSFSFIAGPASGGALIQAVTAPIAMVVDAITFVVSAAAISAVRIDETRLERTPEPVSLLRSVGSGLGFVFRHPYLRPALSCVTTSNFFSFVLNAVLVVFAVRHLELSPGSIGLALGIGATGGIVATVVAGPLGRRIGTGPTIALGAIAFSAPFVFLPFAAGSTTTKMATLAAVQFVSTAGVMLFDIHLNAVQTAVIPHHLRSRVAGVFGTVNYGVRPLGAALGGVVAELVGVGPVIFAAAIGGSLAFLWLVVSPVIAVRRIADLHPVDA